MTLTPATAELATWEMDDPVLLGCALGADVPTEWPPELLRDALPWFRGQLQEIPALTGWLCWYGVAQDVAGGPALAASGGFMGLPIEGIVEIGYSVLPQFQGCGYATEMMIALIDWARAQSPRTTFAAEVLPNNTRSQRVLAKLGFSQNGTAHEPGHLRFMHPCL